MWKALRVRFERLKHTIEYVLYITCKPTRLNAHLSFTIQSSKVFESYSFVRDKKAKKETSSR